VSETQTGSVSDDPGRIIYELDEKLKTANATIISQTAEIDRLRAELQQTQAWRTAATDAHSQSETLRIEQATEIQRLKAEWQSEFTAAQQLRSEVQQLELLLDDARENLRSLEADGTAMDHHCEGMKAAFLAVIETLTGGRA
jgi:chromosome segregation ATPase